MNKIMKIRTRINLNFKEERQGKLVEMRNKKFNKSLFRSIIYILITGTILMIIIAISVFPVFITFGNSMMPTLNQGDIVLSTDDNHYDIGDVVGFYIGNKLLVKRIIADSGQWVEINKDGELFIDGKKKNESYIMDSSLGNCNVEMPFKVPDGYYFVMGDYRTLSIDSRNTIVGCVSDEQIVGRIFFQVWPLRKFGFVDRY